MQWCGLVILTPCEEKTEIVFQRAFIKTQFLSNATFLSATRYQPRAQKSWKLKIFFQIKLDRKSFRKDTITPPWTSYWWITGTWSQLRCWQIVFSKMHPIDHHTYSMADKKDYTAFWKGHSVVSTTIVQVHAHACEYNITTFLCRWVRNQQDNPLPLNNITLLFIGRFSGAHSNKSIP